MSTLAKSKSLTILKLPKTELSINGVCDALDRAVGIYKQ